MADLVECLQWEIKAVSNPRPPWVTGSTNVSKFVFEPVGLRKKVLFFSEPRAFLRSQFYDLLSLGLLYLGYRHLSKKVSL